MCKGLQILKLIKRDPGELGFVIQAKDYDEYLSTYIEIDEPVENVVYTEKEFNILKDYFK